MLTNRMTVPYQVGFGWGDGMRRSKPTTVGAGSSLASGRERNEDHPPPPTESDQEPCTRVLESESVGLDQIVSQSLSDSKP
jgi:hypothetical protein